MQNTVESEGRRSESNGKKFMKFLFSEKNFIIMFLNFIVLVTIAIQVNNVVYRGQVSIVGSVDVDKVYDKVEVGVIKN